MSALNQNPDPVAFDDVVVGIPDILPWEAMFIEAEEQLDKLRPEGFEIKEIGRLAWESLPEGERLAALNVLFLTYWSAMESDREELDRYEREHNLRVTLRSRLDAFEDLTAVSSPVSRDLVAEIASLARQLVGGAA